MICGLLGRHLSHSYSPAIHRLLGDYEYRLFEVEPEDLEAFLKNGSFTGLNVTMPYKQAVIPFLDELSPIARQLGAVNTIVRRADGQLVGHNTDYFGFEYLLSESGLDVVGKKCLVLGSGGASKTTAAVLEKAGAEIVVISRQGQNNYDNLDLHRDASLIVNTTPVGMYPHTGAAPVELRQFPQLLGVLDVVYNPCRTQLLLYAEALQLPCYNGLSMLVAQAKASAQWFTGKEIADTQIERIRRILQKQMENIVLIGMPGCGKSTVGRLLAQRLDRPFRDADEQIEKAAGMSIPAIFETQGEEAFRRLETETLTRLGRESGLVIATGGGAVTQRRNYPLLHQNGRIFLLQRDLQRLPTDGRPLSKDLHKLFDIRREMYDFFSDFAINNNDTLENTISHILSFQEESI